MSGSQTGSIHIAIGRPAVWEQITNLAEIPRWYNDWDRCEHDTEQTRLRQGCRFRLIADRPIVTRVADCVVVTAEEPTLVRWIEHRRLRPPVLVEFRLSSVTAEQTTVTHTTTTATLRRR